MKTLHSFILVVIVGMLLYGCNFLPNDTGGDEILPPQTSILDVRVEPDTVAPGDTASFTCVIEDSTDDRFRFGWLIDDGKVLSAEFIGGDYSEYISNTNSIQWIAPLSKGDYLFAVFVNNGSEDSLSVDDGFRIVVD